jgi:hypothetical protein
MENLSIIIHGPLHINILFTIYRYYQDHSIVVCVPNPEPDQHKNISIFKEITRLSDLPNTSITVITYDKSILSPYYNNHLNRWYHFFSVDLALQQCHTDYAIKIRSDEFYSDLNPFYEAMVLNPSKIVTSDIYFRQTHMYYFHPSDHIMGGKTQILKNAFHTSKLLCENIKLLIELCESTEVLKNQKSIIYKSLDPFTLTPEQMIGIASVLSVSNVKEEIKDMDSIELMKNVFHIVKASDLGVFIISSSSNKVTYTDDSYFQSHMDVNDIENYK